MTQTNFRINHDFLEFAFKENMFGDDASIEHGTSPNEIIINESLPNHFVQLLFALKEDTSWDDNEWQTFTKQYLTELINAQYEQCKIDPNLTLIDELQNENFKSKYPEEIDKFIRLLCDPV